MTALLRRSIAAISVLTIARGTMQAQSAGARQAMTLDQAVQFALAHHPAVSAAAARLDGARAARDVAAAGRLPSADAEAMISGATGNVVAGSFLPLAGVPGSSGPVGTTGLGGGAWTTTAALVSSVPITGFVRANRLTSARSGLAAAASR